MPALMAQRSSQMRNQILRELQRRRKAIDVAKGRVVKKSAAAPPPPRQIASVSGAGTATLKLANAPKDGVRKKQYNASSAAATKVFISRTGAETEYIKKPSSTPIQPRSPSIGMVVKVRGTAKTLPTGQRLVFMHPAVVISDLEDGYLEVMYHDNYPRHGVVRVAMDQVKIMSPPPPPPTK